MVCIMPPDHHLAKRPHVGVHDLVDEKFVGLDASTHTRRLIDGIFEAYGASLKVTLEATTAPDICALVAEGLGVSLLHPLLASSVRGRVAVRPFLPSTPLDFEFCWPINGRNKQLVEAFWKKARTTAEEVVRQLMREA
jgi:DNA-binding transcriptional LysR family regulator